MIVEKDDQEAKVLEASVAWHKAYLEKKLKPSLERKERDNLLAEIKEMKRLWKKYEGC